MNMPHNISDELLINYLLGECSTHEKQIIETWLNESEEHKKYYEQFESVWSKSKIVAQDIEIDEEAAWSRMERRINEGKTQKKLSGYRRISAAAAAIALVLGLFWFVNQESKPIISKPVIVKVDTPSYRIDTIQTDMDTKIATLADESIITLNKKARLETPDAFVNEERRVALKGEAFFEIAHNKDKPFIIETQANVNIRVVGTSFNVKSFEEYTEVIVETGIVELNKGNSIMRLQANDKARIYNQDSIIKVEKKTDNLYKYYRSKKFECDNTPLWKVVEVLNEAYDEKIIIKDKSLSDLRLTTSFDNVDIDIVMEVLSETFEFDVVKKKNTYFIYEE